MQGDSVREGQMSSHYASNQIPAGATVYDANGDKVGTVIQLESATNYMMVEKGWLFPQDVYIPLDAIKSVDANNVYLSYSKDQLKERDWTSPPTATGATATAYTDQAIATERVDRTATTGAANQTLRTDAATSRTTGEQDVRVPLREEELVAGTRQQEAGRIHLHKDVIEEQQTLSVPVTHEEVTIDRHVVDRPISAADADTFIERDIELPVMGEEIVTDKRAKVAEEVHLHKQAVTEQQQVTDTVRREQLHVDDAQGILHRGEGLEQIDETDTTTRR